MIYPVKFPVFSREAPPGPFIKAGLSPEKYKNSLYFFADLWEMSNFITYFAPENPYESKP